VGKSFTVNIRITNILSNQEQEIRVMKNLRILFSAVSMLWFALSVHGQISITSDDFPGPGESMIMQDASGPVTFNPGDPGGNRTWTIPELDWTLPYQIDCIDPGNTPLADQFPSATRCLVFSVEEDTISGTGYRYERIAQNGYFGVGFAVHTDLLDHIEIFSPEAVEAPLPATMGASWTTVERYTLQVGIYTMTHVDSTISNADAWGTITTPFGTFPCLRIFEQNWVKTRYSIPLPPTQIATVSYAWVSNSPAAFTPVSFESEDGVTDPNFTQGYMTIGRIGTLSADPVRGPVASKFTLGQNYPNPFNPTTSLPISLEKAGSVEITVYNELGEIVSSETQYFGPGNHAIGFDGSAWASGNYFAQVRADGQLQTKRMTLVK
jgi:hypothetical protein